MKIISWRRFLTFVTILLLLIILFLYMALRKEPATLIDVQEYQVISGDTLWDIGTTYKPKSMSIQEYIYNLKEFNQINSTIYPNQTIKILIYREV